MSNHEFVPIVYIDADGNECLAMVPRSEVAAIAKDFGMTVEEFANEFLLPIEEITIH